MAIDRTQLAIYAVSKGAAVLPATSGPVTVKRDGSLVTETDLAVQDCIVQTILEVDPSARFLAEESADEAEASDWRNFTGWVLDPIDGTTNFSGNIPLYTISLAYLDRGKPGVGAIWDSVSGSITHNVFKIEKVPRSIIASYTAVDYEGGGRASEWGIECFNYLAVRTRSTRVPGSVALGMLWTAKGFLDLYCAPRPSVWDFAAGLFLLNQSGRVCRFSSFGLDRPSLVCGEPELVNEVLKHMRGSWS